MPAYFVISCILSRCDCDPGHSHFRNVDVRILSNNTALFSIWRRNGQSRLLVKRSLVARVNLVPIGAELI